MWHPHEKTIKRTIQRIQSVKLIVNLKYEKQIGLNR